MLPRAVSFMMFCAFMLNAPLAFAAPNDPELSRQWYVHKLGIDSVWERETGDPSVIVAVIDSGVDTSHPDLHDNIWVNQKEISGDGIDNDRNGYIDDVRGWDFVENDNDPRPSYSAACFSGGVCNPIAVIHGTFVSGVIAAAGNNGIGIAGIAYNAKIMPLRAIDSTGSGNVSAVVNAVRYAAANGADIINLSFVGFVSSEELRQAIEEAYAKGVLVIAAAGNAGTTAAIDLDTTKAFPICFDATNGDGIVLGVSASDEQDRLAGFSNYGPSCVDIAAPGKNFYGLSVADPAIPELALAYRDGFSGTSLAAPVVSGVAALVKARVPQISPKNLTRLIESTARTKLQLQLSDFPDKAPRGIIDPTGLFAALDSSAYPLGDRLALAPTSGTAGVVHIYDGTGIEVGSLTYAARVRPAGIAAVDDSLVISSADGVPSIGTYEYGQGSFQLTSYRRVFPSITSGFVPVAAATALTGQGVMVVAAPRGTVSTVAGITPQGLTAFSFQAFGDSFRGGVSVAIGNVDGDAAQEIIVGAGAGGGPQVRIFEAGKAQGQFFAYDQRDRSGVEVAVGDVSGDGSQEIIVAPLRGAGVVRVFDGAGKRLSEFKPTTATYRGGWQPVVGDFLVDDGNEIALIPLSAGAPVRIMNATGKVLKEFYPLGTEYAGGFRGTALGAGYRD